MKKMKHISTIALPMLVLVMPLVLNNCSGVFDEGAVRPDLRPESERLINKVWLLKEWRREYLIINPETGDTLAIADNSYSYENRKWNYRGNQTSNEYTRALIFEPVANRTLSAVYGSDKIHEPSGNTWEFTKNDLHENGIAYNLITEECWAGVADFNWGWVNTNKPIIKFYFGDALENALIERWEVNRLTDNQLIISGIDQYIIYNDYHWGYEKDIDKEEDIFDLITENDRRVHVSKDDTSYVTYEVSWSEYEKRVKRHCPECIFRYDYALFETVSEPYCSGFTEPCTHELSCQNGGTFDSLSCQCDCPDGFTGELCETPLEGCLQNTPCVNGTVVSDPSGDGCNCECDEGWSGYACSEVHVEVSTVAGGFQGKLDGSGPNAQFNTLQGISLDNSGNLYIADANNHRIRKMTPDGAVTRVAGDIPGYFDGTSVTSQFNTPRDVETDSQGNVYVADEQNHSIRLIDPSGNVITVAGNGTIAIATDGMIGSPDSACFAYPKAVALDAAEEWLYIVDDSYRIMRMKVTNIPAERVIEIVAGVAQNPGFNDGPADQARFEQCTDLALDNNNNIYVADLRNNAVRLVNRSNGMVSTLAGNPPTVQFPINLPANDRFDKIAGIAWTPNGIYITDLLHHRIRVIRSFGNDTWSVGNVAGDYDFNTGGMIGNTSGFIDGTGSVARFYEPYGIVADAQGNLYVADSKNNAIRHVSIGK